MAVRINNHKIGGLKQHKCILSYSEVQNEDLAELGRIHSLVLPVPAGLYARLTAVITPVHTCLHIAISSVGLFLFCLL